MVSGRNYTFDGEQALMVTINWNDLPRKHTAALREQPVAPPTGDT